MTGEARGWGFVPLLLVPLACCVLPVVFAGGAAIGAMALGGTVVGAAVLGGGLGIVVLRRRRCLRDHATFDADSVSPTGR
jgi:hypothetical protein